MRIGIFSDAHYSSKKLTCDKRFCSLSLGKIKKGYSFFSEQKCKIVISLGDLIDKDVSKELDIKHLSEISKVIKESGIETVCLMGNHDAFTFTNDEYYGVLGGCEPTDRDVGGKRLIFCDSCYFGNGERYAPDGGDWTDCFFPFEKEFFAKLEGPGEKLVFIHHNIDPAIPNDHRLFNADALFEGIRKSNGVKTVFQGHYHPGKESVYGETVYKTLPAVCENENAFFVFEI